MAALLSTALKLTQVSDENGEDLEEEAREGEDDGQVEEEQGDDEGEGEENGEVDENGEEDEEDDDKDDDEDPAAKSVLLTLAEGREKIAEIFAANEDSEE